MWGIRGERGRPSRRLLGVLVLAAAIASGISVWQLEGSTAASVPESIATASRGDIVVSVGGVGRIVESGAINQLGTPGGGAAGGSTTSGQGSSGVVASAPAGALFPRATGRISRLLVVPGQHVVAGQVVALLDDGGLAASAVRQARDELATAEVELQQKQISDPARGVPPTSQELVAGQLAVRSSQSRLARLLGPPRPADVRAAQLDVKRAQADLETLVGGSPAALAEAVRLADLNVEVARKRLQRLLAPSPADVSAALADVKRAEAELASLERPSISPAPEALVAAQKSVGEARYYLGIVSTSGDLELIRDAQASLDQALAELAALLRPGPGALPVQIDAAKAALEAAQLKLAQLSEPNPADVQAAHLELARAEADLRRLRAGPTQASLAAARQAVAAARAKLVQVRAKPSAADVLAARLDVRRAEADLAVLRARGGPAGPLDIALARLKIETARSRLESAQAAQRLQTVRASVSGTVTQLLTVRGAPVDMLTPLMTVVDLDRLAVSVALSEFDVAHVKQGLSATVRVDALGGRSFPGKVLFAALSGTDTGGIVAFPVEVGISPARALKPGMSVSVRIIIAERRNVVRVPLEAVTRDDEDRPVVTVLTKSDQTVLRRVTLGLSNNKQVEIVKNLRAGDRVVLAQSESQGAEGD